MDISRIVSKKLPIFINYKPQINGKVSLKIDTATLDASLLDGSEHSVRKIDQFRSLINLQFL